MPYFEELNSIITRYQHHVAEYDKAKWELTVEQRIVHGINHIPVKSAKLQSELIDLDLVRGSSFPKAKPKHGLFTVTRQAFLRFIFLPLYNQWWSAQTSSRLFSILLSLYIAQIFNILLYLNVLPSLVTFSSFYGTSHNISFGPTTAEALSSQNVTEKISEVFGPKNLSQDKTNTIYISEIQTSEILTPIVLMIVLTILHSQIVATATHGSSTKGVTSSKEYVQRRSSGSGSGGSKCKNRKRTVRHSMRRKSSSKTTCTVASGFRVEIDQEEACSPSGIRKVFFEDESKSWTSSNSEKDEGIVDQEHHESAESETINSFKTFPEHPTKGISASRRNSHELQEIIDQSIVEANIAATLKKFAEEEAICLKLEETNKQELDVPTPEYRLRSNLRKRNVSKVSEVSTTSCPDCSSYNNDTSSDEDYREPLIIDDEIRSKSEWTAVTTNSEDDDYEEENIHSDDDDEMTENQLHDHPFAWEFQKHPKKSINPSCAYSDKISCNVWNRSEAMKADLTVLDISSCIIAKVECAKENSDYMYLGICFSILIALLPFLWRLICGFEAEDFQIEKILTYLSDSFLCAYGNDLKSQIMVLISTLERFSLAAIVFFLLSVAEKTYKQRFLYAKLFSRLTSTRKARKSDIPHFRLNKVKNIKSWLSIRSYLQRRGPQRSVDTIVSGSFIATLFLIFFLSVELLKDSNRMYYLYNVEVTVWSLCLGFYLMRFMTLGSKISQKYRNLSVIITEQLNLYLKMEQKPHKKEELLVANNVLKLAADLLKELDDPFKISSFASNPYLYNITRLVILSAFSGVLSEMLGFKLKLYKIKLK